MGKVNRQGIPSGLSGLSGMSGIGSRPMAVLTPSCLGKGRIDDMNASGFEGLGRGRTGVVLEYGIGVSCKV